MPLSGRGFRSILQSKHPGCRQERGVHSHHIHSLHFQSVYRATIVGFNTLHVESVILRNRLRFAVSHQVVREEAMSPCLIVVSVREVESLLVRSSLGTGQTNAPLADKTCGVPGPFEHLGHRDILTQQVILSTD